jgi:uncharacterized iron-regulated membrane protein
VAVFGPVVARGVDWGGYDFRVVPDGRDPISIERAIQVAEAAFPGAEAQVARRPAVGGSWHSHGPTYSVLLARPTGPRLDVLVDPYRGAVVASMVPNSGWANALRQLHVRFFYGSYWGRWIVGLFGLALAFSTVTGVMIFARFNRGSWRPTVRRGKGARIALADLHKVVGLGTAAFNLMFGVSGAVVGLEGLYRKTFPPDAARPPRLAPVASLPGGRIEAIMERASQLVPGTEATAVLLNHRRNGLVKVEVEHATRRLVREHASYVLFNAATGDPVEVYDATRASPAARFYYAMEPLHFGRLGGALWVKLLWGLMGASGGLLSITGFAIYVLRKRKAGAFRPAAAGAAAAIPAKAPVDVEWSAEVVR